MHASGLVDLVSGGAVHFLGAFSLEVEGLAGVSSSYRA